MAAKIPNYAKGRWAAWCDDINAGAATCRIVLLKTSEALDALENYETLAALLAAGGGASNVECNADGYTRLELATVTITTDHTNNKVVVDIPDQSYNNVGATTANTAVKALICYDPDAAGTGTDSTVRVMAISDLNFALVGGATQTLNIENFAEATN